MLSARWKEELEIVYSFCLFSDNSPYQTMDMSFNICLNYMCVCVSCHQSIELYANHTFLI